MSVKIPISDKLIEFLDSRKAKDQEYEDVIWDIIFQMYEKNLEEKMSTSIIDQNVEAIKHNKARSTLEQRIQQRKGLDEEIFQPNIDDQYTDDDIEDEIISANGIIEQNIINEKIHGKRTTLKDRIEKRKQERNLKYPDGTPAKQYCHEDQIPFIHKYFMNSGITVNDYREKYFRRILKKRLIRLQMTCYEEYYTFLKQNPSELAKFRSSLSINFTRFLRTRETWMYLKEDIFPMIITQLRNSNRKKMRIWSAGCAIGAEPYSITLIWSQIDQKLTKNIELTMKATDIKLELLKKAKDAVFSKDHLTELTNKEISTYFTVDNNNYYLKTHLKNYIKFSKLDLVNDEYGSNYDLILCRNVLYYMDDDAKEKILTKFYNALGPGGLIVFDKSEYLVSSREWQFNCISKEHKIYQKS